jgi:hypothetical protein
MAQTLAKRPQIGDVVEIKTSKGLAYAQYTHEHNKLLRFGSLLRVMPGVYPERPTNISRLVKQMHLFVTFFPLKAELRRKDSVFTIIGNEPIPEYAMPFPVFRNGLPDCDGNVHDWWLWDGEKEWKVGMLTPEEIRSYPRLGGMNDTALIQMIENGWSSWDPAGRA